ncbi:1,4-alpha-glucan branching enzyme [Candidatus Kuenenia stuttgartiensis]|uniref:1,4-alpha-glucan branching enzyme GlgB n=2 Tax=Candidatus Brocadiaceae TaxID=1127830 RepID=Q1Q1D9_KUEST|nr:1,4-alpha-glucan branching protein GlgB [Candidatus Kuenenia stuttgartiensis]QII10848.1 1,4-alpha-glucan branching enzyme [Candidatus Kuenenia stuttgartiensis]GJQ49000.1 MAG: 1,4-alpha-glucan branching enzyme GlgB [Candidatus Kuenenia stuttgartiensis]CAJ73819.1 strongly similar to 1,4-alpha-glucan branching enzyme [Candidatus Kuenenia stuttgartiensis]
MMTEKNKTCETVNTSKSLLTDHDIYLFKEGNHFHLYEKLGSHLTTFNNVKGVYFAVWAPNAEKVSVIGDFNNWNKTSHHLRAREDSSGIWEGFVPGIGEGTIYRYHIRSRYNNYRVDKRDPFAFYGETPPNSASIVRDLTYTWGDQAWMKERSGKNNINAPLSVYEIHLGSWRRIPEDGNRFLTYREMAPYLAEYVKETGFTHVELLPVMEHPFYGSWGYQITGFFSPTGRYGTPQDFMYLVDYLHQNEIGVILDWVPSHFPSDEHGLVYFDGTHLYEHADPRKGFHPDWTSYIFNYGRNEVQNFLVSNALFWLDKYHIDGLRVDAVASMLYLDYSRKEGEWIPNKYGGRENIEAVSFLKKCNETIYHFYPDVQTIAEESTAWPMVSRPTYVGGLGFGMKWNMGWMHDTLKYFSIDPIYRKYHMNQITFSILYAFTENFVLPLSHDEVVHGKGSLLYRMPGDEWQKFANLRLLFGYMFGHPGKKLLFMGGEFGQTKEWYHEESLSWHLLQYPIHKGMQEWVKDLNRFYRNEPVLYEIDFEYTGFEWVDFHDLDRNIISFLRKGKTVKDQILVVCNFTPVPRYNYRIGVPYGGFWKEVLNSDAKHYNGSGHGNLGGVEASPLPSHGRYYSIALTLPPLGIVFFKREMDDK